MARQHFSDTSIHAIPGEHQQDQNTLRIGDVEMQLTHEDFDLIIMHLRDHGQNRDISQFLSYNDLKVLIQFLYRKYVDVKTARDGEVPQAIAQRQRSAAS